jgi:hypothetical protein
MYVVIDEHSIAGNRLSQKIIVVPEVVVMMK